MALRSGQLRHRVTIQESTGVNVGGVPVGTWTDVVTVWAAVEDLSGRELMSAQQISADVTTKITMRWRAGISPKMRAVLGTRVFDIQTPGLDLEGRRREMHMLCKERIQDGAITGPPIAASTRPWQRYEITGVRDGVNMVFTIPVKVNGASALIIWNDLIVAPAKYTLNGFDLVTTFAPAADDTFYYFG
jgi:SPP1 family predicted phage head-tail adaptor